MPDNLGLRFANWITKLIEMQSFVYQIGNSLGFQPSFRVLGVMSYISLMGNIISE